MSSAKAIVVAILFTGMSVAIGATTAGYIGYRKAQEKLSDSSSAIGQTVSTLTSLEETMHNIIGDEEGEFGKRAAALRRSNPFTPPPDGSFSQERMKSFLAVKRRLHSIDQEMADEVRADEARQGGGGRTSPALLMKWNFFNRIQRLRMAQIDELERQHMSVEEYNWVHVAVYKAIVAEGLSGGEETRGGWEASMRDSLDQSAQLLERELRHPNTTEQRRREIEQIRARMAESREAVAGLAGAAQKSLAEVPAKNKELAKRYARDLNEVFMAAIDLDTIDFFKALETAQAE